MRLVDSKQMQEMDRFTIEEIGVPGMVLMENAARSWVEEAIHYFTKDQSIFIFCGAGNNGGDGYAIARNLANRGYSCTVIAVKEPKSDDCKKNASIWSHYGKTISWETILSGENAISQSDIIVDSVLGTGIETEIRGSLVQILKEMDELPGTKMAVDLPSGVNASTGDVMGVGVKADYTITFQKEKVGHHIYPGKLYSGKLICKDITIQERYQTNEKKYCLVTKELASSLLPHRFPDSYKNQYGHLATWCGSPGTLGASYLASFAGLKTGVGLTTAAIPSQNRSVFLGIAPELMSFAQEDVTHDWTTNFDALVVGCGLGRNRQAWKKIEAILSKTNIPLVFDADAFYGIQNWSDIKLEQSVLTPHPGEFAQLSGFKKPTNNKERIKQGFEFIERFPTVLVLKGAPTLVFGKAGTVYINGSGNSGMSTAGSGDVLAGIIGGFLAQGLSPLDASLLGTWLHGYSGDLYRNKHNEETLTATSLIDFMGLAFNQLR